MKQLYKRLFIFSFLLIIVGAALWFTVTKSNTTLDNRFIINDTSTVTKIFLADKNNNTLTIGRTNSNGWIINDSIPPIKQNVELLLKTISSTQIKYPVSTSAKNTAIKRLATNHVKVEVYGMSPLFEVFGIKFFTKERIQTIFYVGGPTTDNKGTIMKAEDDDQIYVTYIPGFNGYLTERFSPKIADWKSHSIFSIMIGDIKSVRVDFPQNPMQSYEIINNQNRTFNLVRLYDNTKIENYDTIRVLEFLSAFNSINYDALLDDISEQKHDSILSSLPIRVLSLVTLNGEKRRINMYRRVNSEGYLDYSGKAFDYDMDRLYGEIDGKPILVALQYFVIDQVTRPLSYFLERFQDTQKVVDNNAK